MIKQALYPRTARRITIIALLLLSYAAQSRLSAAQLAPYLSPAIISAADSGSLASNGQTAAAAGTNQAAPVSCAAPRGAEVQGCRKLEAEILDATLRLQIVVKTLDPLGVDRPANMSIGHATVMAGRFLVTHNHFALSPTDLRDGRLLSLSAYRADGSPAIHQAPAHTFSVLVAGPHALVFDFGHYAGQGALDYLGISSARFAAWQSLELQPGTEVAQVNWDGRETYVDWVRVSGMHHEGGAPVLRLDSFVQQGASGGGVFYAGYHVGNNWYRHTAKQTSAGQLPGQYTAVALNEAGLFALAAAGPGPLPAATASLPGAGRLPALQEADLLAQSYAPR